MPAMIKFSTSDTYNNFAHPCKLLFIVQAIISHTTTYFQVIVKGRHEKPKGRHKNLKGIHAISKDMQKILQGRHIVLKWVVKHNFSPFLSGFRPKTGFFMSFFNVLRYFKCTFWGIKVQFTIPISFPISKATLLTNPCMYCQVFRGNDPQIRLLLPLQLRILGNGYKK